MNYKHLHYFWMIEKCGGVAKAAERLHVTPQSISTQMRQLEEALGDPVWRRLGRGLELTDFGHMVFDYADRLFTVGEELADALRGRPDATQSLFRVGVSSVVAKTTAHRLIAPALGIDPAPKLICREGRLNDLLAQLAVHKLDMVLSDRPMQSAMNVRGYNHLLLECGVTFLASPALAKRIGRKFPQCLAAAPVLLPSDESAVRPQLIAYFDRLQLRPNIVAEFDDTAMLKAFGAEGLGVFAVPVYVADEIALTLGLRIIGGTTEVIHQMYAITGERRITHPAVSKISAAAKQSVAA